MKRLSAVTLLTALPVSAVACPACRAQAYAEVFGPGFWSTLGIAALPFVVIGLITSAVYWFALPRPQAETAR